MVLPMVELGLGRELAQLERKAFEERERKWRDGETENWPQEQIEKLFAALGGKGAASRIAAGTARAQVEEIIRVDRSTNPGYPDWLEPVYPDLEKAGPAEYSLSQVQLLLHEYQQEWHGIRGSDLYDWLAGRGLIKDCLGFSDLKAIQNTSLAFFRQNFQDNSVMAWKSVARYRDRPELSQLFVPTLRVEDKRRLVVSWDSIGYMLGRRSPCLIFKKEQ